MRHELSRDGIRAALHRIFIERRKYWDEPHDLMSQLHAGGLVRFGHGLTLELTDKGRAAVAAERDEP